MNNNKDIPHLRLGATIKLKDMLLESGTKHRIVWAGRDKYGAYYECIHESVLFRVYKNAKHKVVTCDISTISDS